VPGARDSRFGVRGEAVGRRQAETTRMDTTAAVPVPKPFMPHPNFSDEVNRNIVQSELDWVEKRRKKKTAERLA
jgi:hypothetical protein